MTLEKEDQTPRIERRPSLPAEYERNRIAQEQRDARDRELFEPRIDKHITVHRIALDFLEDNLQSIADCTDLELTADTRPAALWQLSGRSVGIGRLILDALRWGYTTEVLHLARAAHEADRLLMVFRIPEEGALLRQWLTDEKLVRPKAAREAEERFEKRLAEAMEEMGVETLRSTKELTEHIHGEHSQAAHHRRRWVQDAVFPDLRTMIRGVTPYWIRRAGTTASMVAVVEEIVTQVGDAISYFHGPAWYDQHIKELQRSFELVRTPYPLP